MGRMGFRQVASAVNVTAAVVTLGGVGFAGVFWRDVSHGPLWAQILLGASVILSVVGVVSYRKKLFELLNPVRVQPFEVLLIRASRIKSLNPLVELKRQGDVLYLRCPHEKISTSHGASEELLGGIAAWKGTVGESLSPFPDDQINWNGGVTIARGDDDEDWISQDVSKHVVLLTTIICQHVERADARN